ncbi:MAG TPA: hypothetical protein VGJ32_16880 [Solirubrobacteraceae bacterium]
MRRAIALWLVLFGAYAATLGVDATAGERFAPREAHVLLSAESIASDGFVDLRDEYRAGAWRSFSDRALRPTAEPVDGRLVEPQGLGFPLLVAPAYALGGPVLVELWLAALLALAFVLGAALARRLVPEPWASAAALVTGLSPPALIAATSVSPEGAGALALSAAALAALALRERPRLALAVACAGAIAAVPWLAVELAGAGAVCAVVLARWLRRRSRGWAALAALDLMLFSGVLFVTLHDRLFGGLTPYAASRAPGSPTGLESAADLAARAPRLVGVWLDRDAGLLVWAPFAALALYALWLLWRSHRDRLAVAVREQIDVEVAAEFLAAICAAQVLVAALLAPALHGAWGPARLLVPVLPLAGALAAWGLRFAPRAGAALAALTLAGSAWLLAGARLGQATLAPPAGDVPWGAAARVLRRFGGELSGGAVACTAAVVVALAALGAREARGRRAGALRVGGRPLE